MRFDALPPEQVRIALQPALAQQEGVVLQARVRFAQLEEAAAQARIAWKRETAFLKRLRKLAPQDDRP